MNSPSTLKSSSLKAEIVEIEGQKISKLDLRLPTGTRVPCSRNLYKACYSKPENAQEFTNNAVTVILEREEELKKLRQLKPGEQVLIAQVEGLPPAGLQKRDTFEANFAMYFNIHELAYDPKLLERGIILTTMNKFRSPLKERPSKEDIMSFGENTKKVIELVKAQQKINIKLPQIIMPCYLATEEEHHFDPAETINAMRTGSVNYSLYSYLSMKFYLRALEFTEEELREFSLAVHGETAQEVPKIKGGLRKLISRIAQFKI